jgi:predicted nuclease of restriction endonuclease-like RecB superfamily
VKKLSVNNIKFLNYSDIEDNSVLKSFNNITDLKIETNSDNLEQLLYYFYPIVHKIRNFHLIITTDEDEN